MVSFQLVTTDEDVVVTVTNGVKQRIMPMFAVGLIYRRLWGRRQHQDRSVDWNGFHSHSVDLFCNHDNHNMTCVTSEASQFVIMIKETERLAQQYFHY